MVRTFATVYFYYNLNPLDEFRRQYVPELIDWLSSHSTRGDACELRVIILVGKYKIHEGKHSWDEYLKHYATVWALV